MAANGFGGVVGLALACVTVQTSCAALRADVERVDLAELRVGTIVVESVQSTIAIAGAGDHPWYLESWAIVAGSAWLLALVVFLLWRRVR